MATSSSKYFPASDRRSHDPLTEQRLQRAEPRPVPHGIFRSLGLGLITGAADDDPSAIGTYAAAGAKLGPAFLWVAPVVLPMMISVVYLCGKLGQVSGQGLFAVMREHYPKAVLYLLLSAAVIGNTIEAAADLGGIAAALNLLIPISIGWIVVLAALAIVGVQVWGSYTLMRNTFRWLALALLAYVGAGILAKPQIWPVLRGTLIPAIQFSREYLLMVVAVIGTSMSAYLYSWQSNQEVEEDISMGRRRLSDRRGTTKAELRHSSRDIAIGMVFSNLIMYFILLATASTLFKAGKTDISTAAQVAAALEPLAGKAAALLFAAGIVGVGFLAVPVMTAGAAYDICQTFEWKHGLHVKPKEASRFYLSMLVLMAIAVGMNFLGVNPIKALVWAAVVQGFSTPVLMLAVMRLTNNERVMGKWTNSRRMNLLGWVTTVVTFAASACLVVTMIW